MKKYFLCILCLFLMGCDFKEIRDLSIVSTMGIDIIDDNYKVSVIVMSKEEGESKLYEGEGNSFFKAVQSVNNKLTENLYLDHMQSVIVSEETAKKGLRDILQYFIQEDIIQNNFYLFLAKKTTSKETLQYLMENSGYSLSNLFKENNMLYLNRKDHFIHSFIRDIKKGHKDPIMHSLSLQNNSLSLESLALFKDDKLAGFTDIIGYYLLKGNVKKLYLSFPCEKHETTFSIDHMRFRTSIQNNYVLHHISGDISMQENGCNLKTDTKKGLATVERDIQKMVQEKIDTFLQDQEKWNTNSLSYTGFLFHKNYEKVKVKMSFDIENLKGRGNLHE